MMDFHVEIQQLIKVKGFGAGNRHAHGVADKISGMMVFQESSGYLEKIGLFSGLLYVAFERHQTIFARLVEERRTSSLRSSR